jgi:hypothetical protein
MDAQGFLAALAPAMTDAQARERFLAEPKAVLAAAGLDLPEWFTVTAREGDAPELTITVPGLFDPDTDLSEEQLAAVAGGGLQDIVDAIREALKLHGDKDRYMYR